MNTKKTVLIAEDDANDLFFLRQGFVHADVSCDFKHVLDGNEAVAYLRGVHPYSDRAEHPLPDLVITDLHMPLMGGLKLLAWVRDQAEFSRLPVVVLTASGAAQERAEALALGAQDYYVKPASFSDLIGLVRKLSEKYLWDSKPYVGRIVIPNRSNPMEHV